MGTPQHSDLNKQKDPPRTPATWSQTNPHTSSTPQSTAPSPATQSSRSHLPAHQPTLKTSLEILHFIREYINARGFSPSVRDIQDATNIKSTSTIRRHLDILTDTGYITRTKHTARSIVLTESLQRDKA